MCKYIICVALIFLTVEVESYRNFRFFVASISIDIMLTII